MSDTECVESEPQVATSEPTEPAPATESSTESKSVTFDSKDLTFDEAQKEIDEIKARAGEARQSLRASSECGTTSSAGNYSFASSYTPSAPSNMLSHLNSHSAMLQYKVQTARSLVRKQEDLLRNLARMRENMERSEIEIIKASDFYTSRRHFPRRTYEPTPRKEVAPAPVTESVDLEVERMSDIGSPCSARKSAGFTYTAPAPVVESASYELDEDFEREMAAIRKRVAALGRQANEVSKPRLSSDDYLYDTSLTSSYLRGYGGDIYSRADTSRYEVKPQMSRTPSSSYTNYLISQLDEYPSAVHAEPYTAFDPYDTYIVGVDAF